MVIKNAKVFRESGNFEFGDIIMSGECFSDFTDGREVLDASGCYAIPGLIDIHFHGCVGYDFSVASEEELAEMARYQASNGTTAICPATLTLPEEKLARACRRIATLNDPDGAEVVGIHLEGPFLSYNKRGAQNPDHLLLPDDGLVRRLQKEASGLIKIIALAPELPGAMEFIEKMNSEICCSLAHTEAGYETALEAFRRGARHVTHMFNGMPPFHHRDTGVIGAAIETLDCFGELICDGIHVSPSMVRAAFSLFSDDRIIIISDSLMAAGMAEGVWELGGLKVNVRDGAAYLADSDTLAGSISPLMECVRIVVNKIGIPLESAVKCASANPAKAIGIYDKRGSITSGKIADLVLLNEDLSISKVFLKGKPLTHH